MPNNSDDVKIAVNIRGLRKYNVSHTSPQVHFLTSLCSADD